MPGYPLLTTSPFVIVFSLFVQNNGWRVMEQSRLVLGSSTYSTNISLTTLEASHYALEVLPHLLRPVSHRTWSKQLAAGLLPCSKFTSDSIPFSLPFFFAVQARHLSNDLALTIILHPYFSSFFPSLPPSLLRPISCCVQLHFRRCHWCQGISVFRLATYRTPFQL